MLREGPLVQERERLPSRSRSHWRMRVPMDHPKGVEHTQGTTREETRPRKVGDNILRQKFVGIRNVAECPKWEVKGALKLTGGSIKVPLTIKCGKFDIEKVRKEAESVIRNILKGFQMTGAGQKHEQERQVEFSQERYSNIIQISTKRMESMGKRIKELEEKAQASSKIVTILDPRSGHWNRRTGNLEEAGKILEGQKARKFLSQRPLKMVQ